MLNNTASAATSGATGTVPNNGANGISIEEMCKVARELGGDKGRGDDAKMKFAMKVLEWSYNGFIDTNKNKYGTGMSDASRLAHNYIEGTSAALIYGSTSNSKNVLTSNFNKLIKIGTNPRWSTKHVRANINDLLNLRATERKAGHKVDDAFNMLMRYSTAQLNPATGATLITGPALKAFVYRKEGEEQTLEDFYEGIKKKARKLRIGKLGRCPDTDNSPELSAIVQSCDKRLLELAKQKAAATAPSQAAPPVK